MIKVELLDLEVIQIFVVTQECPSQHPQPAETLAKLPKFHVLVNKNDRVFYLKNLDLILLEGS